MTSARHAVALVVAGALGALGVASCASVVGVDGYQDAAEVLCKCNELAFDGDCTRNVQRALEAADPAVAQKWLTTFDKKNCGDSCGNALTCYNQPPVCRSKGKSCSKSTQCCGYVGGKGGCCSPGPGEANECCTTCQTCAEVFLAGEAAPGVPYCAESDELIASVLQCMSDAFDKAAIAAPAKKRRSSAR